MRPAPRTRLLTDGRVFCLQARRSFEQRVCQPGDPWHLFLFGRCANAYDVIDGVDVWVHGTFGDASYCGYEGRYFAIAADRSRAVWRENPCLSIVRVAEYKSVGALLAAHPWRTTSQDILGLYTYCNWSVSFCRHMVYGKPGLQYATWGGEQVRQWVANEIWRELWRAARGARRNGGILQSEEWSWIALDPRAAQEIANLGGFVIAVARNGRGSGHVVFLVEDPHYSGRSYDLVTREGQRDFLSIPCLHVGLGKPRIATIGEAFSCLGSKHRGRLELERLARVRLYCDLETWQAYTRQRMLVHGVK